MLSRTLRKVSAATQNDLFSPTASALGGRQSSTFVDNMALPVHRWFRYSAGFSAGWVTSVLERYATDPDTRVLDPFAGSGTTLLCAEHRGTEAVGLDAHPFVVRVARAKLLARSDPEAFAALAQRVLDVARARVGDAGHYPDLILRCYDSAALERLDALRRAVYGSADDSAAWALAWLCLVCILRPVSNAGTAPWQYVLPSRVKASAIDPFEAFAAMARLMIADMTAVASARVPGPLASMLEADARECAGVPDAYAHLVVTSPPYANNYDYADATRLEMSFLGEISGWGELQQAVRRHLVRSCSQHVPERAVDLEQVLSTDSVSAIRGELADACRTLAAVRLERGGKKTYHLMVACYFADMARVWTALRRVTAPGGTVCFVLGDSAPYGVHVPVMEWHGRLAEAAGFRAWRFEHVRDRNTKWKNRKHRVPLSEGFLWVDA